MAKIHLIEDDSDTLYLMKRALKGHEVSESLDLESAVLWLSQSTVDLILTDLKLPGEPTPELIIRGLKSLAPSAKILILSGNGELRAISQRLGVEYLMKPFSMQVMLEKIQAILN